jgi:hypothetical protein
MDFMNLSWYYYIDHKGSPFPQPFDEKSCGRGCVRIPTLPNVGTAMFEVCVEEMQ